MHGWQIGTAALCAMTLGMSSANAQTRQETVDFIFHNANDVNGLSANDRYSRDQTLGVSENNCVVTLVFHWTTIKYTGEDESKNTAILKIYFDKLIVSSETVSHMITIGGKQGSVVKDYRYGAYPEKNQTYVEDNLRLILPDNPLRQRVVNALKYFVTNFCPGSASAF
jgi:hypothetical protein